MKVLILTIKREGAGGEMGKILKDYMENKTQGSEVEIIDFAKYINPILDKLITSGFIKKLRGLNLYSKLSSSEKDQQALEGFNEMLSGLLWIKLKEIIDDFNGDAIVAVHPFYLKMMDIINSRWKILVPVIAMLCNSSEESPWIYNYISAYIVPDDGVKTCFIKLGVPEQVIYPHSILMPNSAAGITNFILSISNNRDISQGTSS